ncbi:MAG: hypothetical protein ACREER_02010 [Alphaproteobacteria bacterium]
MRAASLAALMLGACASAPTGFCPALRDYTPEFQNRLADEIEAAPHTVVWPSAIRDYVGLRDQIRAACPD